ncbi:MAG: acyl-CoA dehydrogenase [Alphaproteobacteria bacterium]|nr:MAG: acyl-CoA dehydrogenase [Alphaproteobacteria bacterium]
MPDQDLPFELSPGAREMVSRARGFARGYLREHAPLWERERRMGREGLVEAAKLGLTRLDAPREEGGEGFLAKLLVLEALSEEDMGFAFSLTNTQGMAGRLMALGTPSQRTRFLDDVLATRRLAATCLSEPGAGSDFAGITTTAVPCEGGWRLSGTKGWITNAAEADLFLVYAQTEAAQGWRGIASFLVDGRQAGFERAAPYALAGGHVIGVGGFTLTDFFVPQEDVIAPAGEAFKSAMGGVNQARTYVAGMVNAMVASALSHAVQYGRARRAFGAPLLANQGLQWSLTDVANKLEASRALTYRAAALIERGEDAMLAAAHAKKFAGDYGVSALAACIQAMGARGMLDDVPLGRHLICAKLACYTDGSTEMQNERIAKSLGEMFG